jgi:hypothetical protein
MMGVGFCDHKDEEIKLAKSALVILKEHVKPDIQAV